MDAGRIPPTYPFHVARAYGTQPSRPRGVDKLVAGKVSVPVNHAAGPSASDGALPMYRNPADKNAAATGVSLGRMLDLNG